MNQPIIIRLNLPSDYKLSSAYLELHDWLIANIGDAGWFINVDGLGVFLHVMDDQHATQVKLLFYPLTICNEPYWMHGKGSLLDFITVMVKSWETDGLTWDDVRFRNDNENDQTYEKDDPDED